MAYVLRLTRRNHKNGKKGVKEIPFTSAEKAIQAGVRIGGERVEVLDESGELIWEEDER